MNASYHPKQILQSAYERLRKVPASPRIVAGGVAVGMFWAFTPLLGLKTLLAFLSAWSIRCSKVAAIIAVSLHDFLTPMWPLFLRWEYDLGFYVLHHHFPKRLSINGFHIKYWLHWNTFRILWPTLLGSLAFAVPSAIISFFIVELSLRQYQKRRAKADAEAGAAPPAG